VAPGCCTVVHIERFVTSAWPGIAPSRGTHNADRGPVLSVRTELNICRSYPSCCVTDISAGVLKSVRGYKYGITAFGINASAVFQRLKTARR
jgi:hypothetical protein